MIQLQKKQTIRKQNTYITELMFPDALHDIYINHSGILSAF